MRKRPFPPVLLRRRNHDLATAPAIRMDRIAHGIAELELRGAEGDGDGYEIDKDVVSDLLPLGVLLEFRPWDVGVPDGPYAEEDGQEAAPENAPC